VGWSFGGILAYEVARQLVAHGRVVDFVGLLDAVYDRTGAADVCPDSINAALLADIRGRTVLTEAQSAGVSELIAVASDVANYETLVQKCEAIGIMPGGLPPTDERDPGVLFRRYAGEFAHSYVHSRYTAPTSSLHVSVFAAAERSQLEKERNLHRDPLRGWGAVLPEEQIEVISIPGDHLSMMDPPHASVLGRALSRVLRRLDERPTAVHGPIKNPDPPQPKRGRP
jgi:arthrofactin-type cyclic lipopeptide synthetase C